MDNICHENRMEDDRSKTNLIVNYLPETMTQKELKALFSSIGDIESCKVICNKSVIDNTFGAQRNIGYGFVNFYNHEDAEKAIEKLNGYPIQNKIIKVSYARPSSEVIKGTNLYISGLPQNMSDDEFVLLFNKYGKIITSRLLPGNSPTTENGSNKPKTGPARAIGFIRYDKKSEAEKAIQELNGKILDDMPEGITVKFAHISINNNGKVNPAFFSSTNGINMPIPGPHYGGPVYHQVNRFRYSPMANEHMEPNSVMPPGWSIFVYNLNPDVDEMALWQLFGPFGAVQSVKIIKDPQTNKCKGFGFVVMARYDEASMAISRLNGCTFDNRVLQVSFKANRNKT